MNRACKHCGHVGHFLQGWDENDKEYEACPKCWRPYNNKPVVVTVEDLAERMGMGDHG